jgi:hypothetical protein
VQPGGGGGGGGGGRGRESVPIFRRNMIKNSGDVFLRTVRPQLPHYEVT